MMEPGWLAAKRVAFWFPDDVSHLGRQLMLLALYDTLFLEKLS